MKHKTFFWIELIVMLACLMITLAILAALYWQLIFYPLGAIAFYFEMRSDWKKIKADKQPANAGETAAPINYTPTIPTESQKTHAKKLIDMSVKGAEK